MIFRALSSGDWIATVGNVPVSVADTLAGDGLPAGTRGVVLEPGGRHVLVELDGGWGTVRARLCRADVRVVRRRGGVEPFRSGMRRLAVVRAALAVALMLPVLRFAAEYLWAHRTADGMAAAFAFAVIDSAQYSIVAAAHQPGKALLYFAVVAVLWRVAFGRRRS